MTSPKTTEVMPPFLTGGGKCSEIIASRDWSATPLGPIATWPAILKNTLSIIMSSPVPIVTLWGEPGVMLYNDAYSGFAAGRHPVLLGSNVREGWPEVADFNDNVMKVGLSGRTLRYEDQELTLHRNGVPEQVWMNLDYSPIFGESGQPVAVMAIVVETTGKVRAKRALQNDRERLRRMFEQAPGFIAMMTGPQHVFELANPAYMELVGERGIIGKTVKEALPEVAGQGFFELLDAAFFEGVPTARLAEPLTLNRSAGMAGETRYLDFSYQPVRDAAGEILGVFVQGNDVTAHIEAQRAVRESEERFRTFAQALPCQVWSADAGGRIDWINERSYQYTGMAEGSLRDEGWSTVTHPDDATGALNLWSQAVRAEEAFEREVRLRGVNGVYRWHLSRALPVRNADGAITRWIGVNMDIHDQKTAAHFLERVNEDLEQKVAESAADRERMWRLSTDLMLVAGLDGSIVSVNPAWTDLLGWTAVELIGQSFMSLVHPDDVAATLDEVRRLSDGNRTLKFVNRFRRREGGYFTLSWTAVPDNDIIHAVGRDISADVAAAEALRQTELALQQSQRMETIGKLTGGVAHDFNNLLQVISGNLQLLSKDVQGNEKAERRLQQALAGVNRGGRLASQLLAFGRRQALEPKAVRLARLVAEMDDMLRRSLGDAIEVETVMSGGLWNTFVDPGQLENAILNLAINARDAMEGQGKLTIEVVNAVLDDTYAYGHPEVEPGQYVMLAVTDTGSGMTPEVMSKAYEPFFSTKPEGKGSGLGLSMVYGFVKQSGGHIKLYSEPGHGTTVRLYLPRTLEAEVQPVVADLRATEGGTEVVLVAEDDEQVRATVIDMLNDLGYRVLRANDAISALAIVESGVHIDLLFTDVVMPGTMKSTELARKARERIPGIAVLFTSGYTENSIVHGGRLDAGVELLSKPYSREALARKIRRVLGNESVKRSHPLRTEPEREHKEASLRILYVEDDDLIRAVTVELLESFGHVVLEATDSNSALALLEKHGVDVLLTDIGLPDVPGDELALLARQRQPGLSVIFATGQNDAPPIDGVVLLRKPYDTASLAHALRRVVETS